MNQFRKGDVVKRVHPNWRGIRQGETYTVDDQCRTTLRLVGLDGVYSPNAFELVKTRRPHYDLIIARANGAQIQYRSLVDGWTDTHTPQWGENMEYRIKERELEIERIESEMRKLADDLKQLKGQ